MDSAQEQPVPDGSGDGRDAPAAVDPSEPGAGHVEIERKFECPRRWSMPRLAGTGRVAEVSAPRRMTQTATYLDTLDLDLLEAKYTLRRRTGGTDAGWHLKKPATGDARLEVTAPLGRGTAHVPTELREEITDLLGPAALVPVAVLRTRRTRRELRSADGTVLGLVEDDAVEARVLIGGERIHRWREVELELVDGTAEDLATLADALTASGLLPSQSPSKLQRALDGVVDVSHEGRHVRAGEVVLRYIATQVGVIQAGEGSVRVDAPDAVHRVRVATRRLRSALRSYRRLFDRTATDPLREEIKWLTGALGGPRDAEVMRERLVTALDALEPALVRGPVVERLHHHLDATHDAAHAGLVAALDSRRYTRLLDALVDLLLDPPFRAVAEGPAAEVLPGAVGSSSAKVDRTAARVGGVEDPEERHHAIHDVRKRAKAARYAAEAAGKHLAGGPKKVVSAWTDVQEALGEHQDSVVARRVIDEVYEDARKAREDTFTYGVLVEEQATIAREIESRSDDLLAAAREAAAKSAG